MNNAIEDSDNFDMQLMGWLNRRAQVIQPVHHCESAAYPQALRKHNQIQKGSEGNYGHTEQKTIG